MNYNAKPSGLEERVKGLFSSQRLCVLSTDFHGQPYSNLVAFAETDDLRSIIFATNRKTRKYSNALLNKKVAVLVDSRTNTKSDFDKALAVTAIGIVEEVEGIQRKEYASILISKHPSLESFIFSDGSTIMRVYIDLLILANFSKTETMHFDRQNNLQ
jgi:heme iron utilization protein